MIDISWVSLKVACHKVLDILKLKRFSKTKYEDDLEERLLDSFSEFLERSGRIREDKLIEKSHIKKMEELLLAMKLQHRGMINEAADVWLK